MTLPRKERSKQDRKAPVDCRVRTIKDLCEQLGMHQNTATAWRKMGAPSGPPYSVVEWYLWARLHSLDVELPKDPMLQAMCRVGDASAGPRDDSELLKLVADQLGGVNLKDVLDPSEKALAVQRITAAMNNFDSARKTRRTWVPVSAVKRLWALLSSVIMEQMQQVDTAIDALPRKLTKERKALLKRMDEERAKMRQQLAKEGEEAVRKLLLESSK